MKAAVRKVVTFIVILVVLFVAGYLGSALLGKTEVNIYSVIFSKTYEGVVENVEKVSPQLALVGGGVTAATSKELFSFAVGLKLRNGEIVTGTSEDRQWAIVQKGQCATAKFYPYPPWELDKSQTFFNVRLLKLVDCGGTVSK